MLVFYFRPQRETLDIIELRLSDMLYDVIEYLTKCHDWILWLDLINTITLLKLVIIILWFDLFSSILWSDSMKSYFLIIFNYFNSNVLPLTYPWKVVKDSPNHILENMIG